MARERQTQSSSSAGLLSGVFSFVSKEIESFVTTATGGEVSYLQYDLFDGCRCLTRFVGPKS